MFRIIHFIAIVSVCCLVLIKCRRVKRVIGGVEIPCDTFIRAASLQNASSLQHLCGATILSPTFALTAAHCVSFNTSQYVLKMSNSCPYHKETIPTAEVLEIITHPLYDKYSRAHDIALLRISLDLTNFNITKVNDVLLPVSSFGLSGECRIYGYGIQSVNTMITAKYLKAATVKIISLDDCLQRLGPFIAPEPSSGMLCAVGGNADACQGDSGGPLICEDSIQGICSYGLSCGVPNVPGIYTSIGAHISWIHQVMG